MPPTTATAASLRLLEQARSSLHRLTPTQAHAAQQRGARIVDVRTSEHRAAAENIPGALVIDLTVLPWRLDPEFSWRIPEAAWDVEWVVICRHGFSSSLAARALQDMGLNATDVIGGYEAWVADGLPTTTEPADVRP